MFPVCYSFLPITDFFSLFHINVLNNVPKSYTLNIFVLFLLNVLICPIMFLPTENFRNIFIFKGTFLCAKEHYLANGNIFMWFKEKILNRNCTSPSLPDVVLNNYPKSYTLNIFVPFLLNNVPICSIMFLPTEQNFEIIFRRKGTFLGAKEHF